MKIKKIIIAAIFAIVAVAVLYGVREIRLNHLDDYISQDLMVDGLLVERVSDGQESYLVPPDEIYDAGLTSEEIAPIDNPVYTSVDRADEVLADGIYGIDVEVNGDHRFYSYQILNWHEVVNDNFNGVNLTVTLCPLCRSAIVYKSDVNGEALSFEFSGKVYNNNFLLMDRETESLWQQSRGLAISGDLIGTELEQYPSVIMLWSEWKIRYPNGEVLSTDTGFVRDYTRHPYSDYDTSKSVYFPLNETSDDLSQKWIVNGVGINGDYMAFSKDIIRGFVVANETVGDTQIVAFYDNAANAIRVFEAVFNGEVYVFNYDFDTDKITDENTGSVWSVEGIAVSGKMKGSALKPVESSEMFWFCWYAMHPDTSISSVTEEGELAK